MGDFNNTYVCPAPIAIQGRHKTTLQTVDKDIFDEFTVNQVSCPLPPVGEISLCNITDFEFRYLCDRSTLRIHVKDQVHVLSRDPAKGGILGIEAETGDHSMVERCAQSYHDDVTSVTYMMDPIRGGDGDNFVNHINQNEAHVFCRFDNSRVGHFHFAFKTHSMGRASLPWDAEYFDANGNTVSITLAPGIHTISPYIGSSEGGTLMTIRGQGFYQSTHVTEVSIGGDTCIIEAIDDTTIICRTSKPTYDPSVSQRFPGGSGAKTYFHNMGQRKNRGAVDWYSYEKVDADNTRFIAKDNIERGWYNMGVPSYYYVGHTEAAFLPPVTGYYSMIKVNDDMGKLYMDVNGTMDPSNRPSIVASGWSSISQAGPYYYESISDKMYFEAGKYYPFDDFFANYGGRSRSSVGLIFHGQDPVYNLVHSPLPDVFSWDGWQWDNERLQVVTESQINVVSALERHEIHKIWASSGAATADNIRFALRWSNSNGQTKDTPMGTYSELYANNGARIKTLLQTQCSATGSIQAVARLGFEGRHWTHSSEESYCGQKASYIRWSWILRPNHNTDLGQFTQQVIADVPHLCFAYFGTPSAGADLRIYVGWMGAGSNTTFGTLQENLKWDQMQFNVHYIPGFQASTQWDHRCINIENLIRNRLNETGDQNPQYADHIYIQSIYGGNAWGWIDDVELGIASPDYAIVRDVSAHRPNTKILQLNVGVNNQDKDLQLDMQATGCGIDIPEMTVIPESGATVTVVDINVFDINDNPVVGKAYELRNNNGDLVVIEIYEFQKISPGISGDFRFDYLGIKTPLMSFGTPGLAALAASEIRKLHGDLATNEIEITGDCNMGWTFDLQWSQGGDFDLVKLENVNIAGLNISIESREYRSGGVLVRALPGAYMATLHDQPQVQVKRNNILARCNNVDCDFGYTAPAIVSSISPTNFGVLTNTNSLAITGAQLSDVTRVVIGGMDCTTTGILCTVTAASESSLDVSFTALPYGTLNIEVYTSIGLALNQASQQITVAPQPITVTPSSGVQYGGNVVTLSGTGVGLGNDDITIGGAVASIISRSLNEIVLTVPEGAAEGNVNIAFANGIVIGTYTYDNTNAVTITLSKNDFSVLGEQAITITFDQLLTTQITIYIEDEVFGVVSLVNQDTLDFSTPPHAAGKGLKFKIDVEGVGFTNSINVRYRLTLTNVKPLASSTSGGATLTINGRGFGTDMDLVEVTIGDRPCLVQSLTNKQITCITRPYYKTHDVFLTGESWYPQRLSINQNDRVRWQWVTQNPINVEIQSVDSMTNTTGNGIFSIPLVAGSMGDISRIVKESPGTYYVSSGYMDAMYSIYANGEITVNQAVDYEEDVIVRVGGFEAMPEESFKDHDKGGRFNKACGAIESDIPGKDLSTLATTACHTCLKHTYSFQRTPVASTVSLVGDQLTVTSPSVADHDGCPQDFTVKAWSPTGEVAFTVDAINGNTLIATMETPSNDWPIGVQLELWIMQNNRGMLQIDASQLSTMVVDATVTDVTPLRGAVLGEAIMRITGTGLYSRRYKTVKVSACAKILSHTATEITCRTFKSKPAPMAVELNYYIAEVSGSGMIVGIITAGGMITTKKSDYRVPTGFTYQPVRQMDIMSNENQYFNGLAFHYSAEWDIPTPVNLTAYAIEVGNGGNNPQLPVTATSSPIQGSTTQNISLTLLTTSANEYNYYFQTNNFGFVHAGRWGRGVTVLSIQYVEGSRGGGHELLLTTTDHGGVLPGDHRVLFNRHATDACHGIVDSHMCRLWPVGNNQMIVTTPNVVVPDDDYHFYLEFRPPGGQWGSGMIYCTGCQYHYRRSLTPILTNITATEVSVGDSLTAIVDSLDKGFGGNSVVCTDIKMYIGDIECPVSACDNSAGSVTCTVPGQADGNYPVRVNFPLVGDADYSSNGNTFSVMMIFDVSSITPLTGSYGGGTLITLTGTGFGPETFNAYICGEPLVNCQFSADGSQVICETPEVSTDQICTFVFLGPDGNPHDLGSRAVFSFNFDAGLSPVITQIENAMGGSMGGTRITIRGTGFVAGSNTVMIGSSSCDIKQEGPKRIICETNAHPTSTKHRVIVTVGSQGNAAAPDPDQRVFWYIDRWSSHFTWGCNDTSVPCPNKPAAGDIAVIPAGKTVLLDESTPILSVLLIQGGTLLWAHQDGIKLSAQYILITDMGHFEAGTATQPLCGPDPQNPINADIELFGHHRSIKLPVYGAKVFAVRNGTIDIHGCPIGKTWTVLSATADAGSNTISVKDTIYDPASPMTSWKVNDTIVIATTGGRGSMVQNEKRRISALSGDGRTITLDVPLQNKHFYHKSTWDGEELEMTAEVGLLTRNIRFYGNRNEEWSAELPDCDTEFNADEHAIQNCYLNKWNDEVASDEFGAHLLLHYITRARLSHIEVFHAGQGFQLGRYPLHFHNSGNQPDSYISNNAIHDTFNRAITMHGVWNATIEWNVAYNCMGHNYFIEDAVEEDLLIQYNLAVHIKPSFSLLTSDQRATGFWITNTYNTIQHNHAAGGAQVGFWVNPPEESGHANADCPPIVRSHCPVYTPVKRWFNNTAHDMGLYGFWVFAMQNRAYYRPSTADCMPTWPPGNGVFERGIMWNCDRGAELAIVGNNVWMKNFIVANNEAAGLAVMETHGYRYQGEFDQYSAGIQDSISIGVVDYDIPELSGCTQFGIQTPWTPHGSMSTEGIKFFNFNERSNGSWVNTADGYEWRADGCTAIDACYDSYPFDCGRTSHWERVEYFNTTRKFAADWEHETVLVDRDGTLTGANIPGYSVVPKSALYPPSMCVDAPEFSVEFPSLVCNSIEYNRYGMHDIKPDSLRGYSMIVRNRWGESEVPFRNKRSTDQFGWMGILLSGEHHDMHWKHHEHISNVSYTGQIYDVGMDKFVTIRHPFAHRTDYARINGRKLVLDDVNIHTGAVTNHTMVDDTIEYFNGWDRGDNLFTTSDLPFTYHINSIDNSLTYIVARDTSPNKFYDVKVDFTVYKCFWPGCTPPTTAPPTTPPVIATLCNWSDPSCWATGVVPAAGSNVTIDIDKEVTIDVDINVDHLYVEGTVLVGNATDITISARNILINTGAGLVPGARASVLIENGNFFAGSETEPWSCSNTLTINMYGDQWQPEYGAPFGTVPLGGKTIGVMGGLKLFGCPQSVRYALLDNRIQPGDTTMTLDTDVSTAWNVGDEIAIAPTSYDTREAERVTITGISGSTVTFSPPVNFTHTGVIDTTAAHGHMGAEVSHLTRNIIINGNQDSNDIFGGRIVVVKSDDNASYRRGWAQIDNVQFAFMGQFGHTLPLDLRMPVAFYHLGPQTASDPERSFISNSAFHDSFNGAIAVGEGMDGMNVTGNVVFKCVSDAIRDHGVNTLIENNVITFVIYRFFHQGTYVAMLLANLEPENVNLPAGINTLGSMSSTVRNNRVAGGDGPAYKGHGEACTSRDLCQSGGPNGPQSVMNGNVGHSTVRGASIVKEYSRPCSRYSGYYFWRILDFGIYTQALGSEIHMANNIIVDAVVGVCNIVVGNGAIVDHVHGRMMLSFDNNMIVGRSIHHTCADYNIRDNALIITSGLTTPNRAPRNRAGLGGGTGGFWFPLFAVKETKFPKKPIYSQRQATYNSPNGRTCANGNLFHNFGTDHLCGQRQSVAITSNPATNDHSHMIEIQNSAFNNTSEEHKALFTIVYRGIHALSNIFLILLFDQNFDKPKNLTFSRAMFQCHMANYFKLR